MKKRRLVRFLPLVGVAVLLTVVVAAAARYAAVRPETGASAPATATVRVSRGTFVRTVRVAGITEAVRATAAIAPRLAGQNSPSLVITRLVTGGSRVAAGEVLVEFDPQAQTRAAFDRRTELQDLEQQLRRLEAEQAAARAGDETAVKRAENDVERAKLEVLKNRFLPTIEAEKNTLALQEAEARLVEIREARALRRRTDEADMKVLEIRRQRAEKALTHAEGNTELMVVRAPFEGLAVLQPTFKGSQMTEIQEGDEVRSGMPIVNVVDPSRMQVRARVSQADGSLVAVGQRARISLDAYPSLAFDGRVVQVAPLAISSSVTPAVRGFVAVIAVEGSDPNLMPDLSAAVDIVVSTRERSLLVPRSAIAFAGPEASVRRREGGSFAARPIAIQDMNADVAVASSGVAEGDLLARRARGGR
ncbi:MAG: efflux RND transporter periplasmic adaptor subunit [Bacteroidales bacterium]